MANFLDLFSGDGGAGCDTGGSTILPSTSFFFGDTVMKCVGVGSAFSLTNLCGSDSAGCTVSTGSRSGDRLVLSCDDSVIIGMS